jgi:hypothetical protein
MYESDLKNAIAKEIESGYERLYKRSLPAFLKTVELDELNIRARTALDKDATTGKGLLPLGNMSKGKPRRYLVSHVIDFLAG